jgi:hypothetical protein
MDNMTFEEAFISRSRRSALVATSSKDRVAEGSAL